MAADNMLRRWAMWVDGVGKAGNATSYTPPVINVRTTDFESGDMDMPVPVDDGMDPLEASFPIAFVSVNLNFRHLVRGIVHNLPQKDFYLVLAYHRQLQNLLQDNFLKYYLPIF